MSGTISISSDDAIPRRVSQWMLSTEAKEWPALLASVVQGTHCEKFSSYVCFVPLPEKVVPHPAVSLLATLNPNPVEAVAVKTIRSNRVRSMSGLSAAKLNPIPALPRLIDAGSAVRDTCTLEADGGVTHVAVVDGCTKVHQHQPSGPAAQVPPPPTTPAKGTQVPVPSFR
jgi:hypothetical protein